MTAEELAQCWVPVPLRWRHVQAGDVFVGADGALWAVWAADSPGGPIHVSAHRGPAGHTADVDPDNTVQVLVPVTEADAVNLTREQLGARLMERRAG